MSARGLVIPKRRRPPPPSQTGGAPAPNTVESKPISFLSIWENPAHQERRLLNLMKRFWAPPENHWRQRPLGSRRTGPTQVERNLLAPPSPQRAEHNIEHVLKHATNTAKRHPYLSISSWFLHPYHPMESHLARARTVSFSRHVRSMRRSCRILSLSKA